MSLLRMSLSGGVLIAVVVLIRAIALNRLPKNTFLALWAVALARLLVPFTLPSAFSVYSLMGLFRPSVEEMRPPAAVVGTAPVTAAGAGLVTGTGLPLSPIAAPAPTVSPWGLVWLVGALACVAFFGVAYWRCRREFRASLPVRSDFAARWLGAHRLRRKVALRQSDRISAPLTYGVFRPVILMPKGTDWSDTESLRYVLAHELVHIRRFDAATKLLLTGALCVHWFNPLVWAMYALANRDLELSCDEAVVRRFGQDARAAYARALLRMEERRSHLRPLCNSFSKNALEERIVAIMKLRKRSLPALVAALMLVVCVATAFATSGQVDATPAPEATLPSEAQTWTLEEAANWLKQKKDELEAKLGEIDWSPVAGWYTWTREKVDEAIATYEDAVAGLQSVISPDKLPEVEWWTAEEFAAWLEQEKAELESIIGERSWTPSTGWYTWTREKVEETIALYESMLEDIRKGVKISKSISVADGELMFTIGYDPSEAQTVEDTAIVVEDATDTREAITTYTQTAVASAAETDALWEHLPEYEAFGLTYDAAENRLYFRGEPVRYFQDGVEVSDGNVATAYQYLDGRGTVSLYTVRETETNPDGSVNLFGKLVGIEPYPAGEPEIEIAQRSQVESTATGSVESTDSADLLISLEKYAAFGVTFEADDSFGNLYWNGEPVRVLIDATPDGIFRTFTSTNESGLVLQAVYDEAGKLAGVEAKQAGK